MATVTNQDLGVTTKTSGHEAQTTGATDVNFDPPKKKPSPHPNAAPTANATQHTTDKTKFEGGNVVRVGDAVTPSNPAHPDSGGGVVSGTYRKEARATKGSPDVRAEAKPPARTTDPTTQNHANTTGKMSPPGSGATISALPDDHKKRCSYDTSTIKCDHGPAVTLKQIDVWRGDNIIVSAKRKNAKEPGKDPACSEPPHMKWHVTRTGGLDAFGAAQPPKTEDFTGDTLTLPGEWTGSSGQFGLDGNQNLAESKSAKQYLVDQKNAFAQSNAAIRGSTKVEGQDTRLAYQQVKGRMDQIRADNDGKLNALRTGAKLALNAAQFYNAWRAHQNPPKLVISGAACSGAISYEVHGYPNGKYTFEIPLDGMQKAGRWMSKAMTVVTSVGKLANIQVENSLQCPGPGASVGIGFQWKEDDGGSYKICREAEIQLAGQLLAWAFEVKVPLTNFLAIIPVAGPTVAGWVGWALQKLGVDASIGIGVNIGVSLATSVAFKWTKADGWKFDNYAPAKIPIDFKFYVFARIKLRDWVHIEGRAAVEADPAFALEKNDQGLHLQSSDFMIRVGFSGVIHVDLGLYTFHEAGTWYPESWTCRVPKKNLWTIMSN